LEFLDEFPKTLSMEFSNYLLKIIFYGVVIIPGPIMTVSEAVGRYPGKFLSLGNGRYEMRNTDGRKITVTGSQRVYHRGNGRFAPYTAELDEKRKSAGAGGKGKRVGSGPYKQTDDRRSKGPKCYGVLI
jgi:hypothetical protein